jgi:hypothetical protein
MSVIFLMTLALERKFLATKKILNLEEKCHVNIYKLKKNLQAV